MSDQTYTQVLLKKQDHKTGDELYITRWIASSYAKDNKTIHLATGTYKVYETYASYKKAFVDKYPKDFKIVVPIT